VANSDIRVSNNSGFPITANLKSLAIFIRSICVYQRPSAANFLPITASSIPVRQISGDTTEMNNSPSEHSHGLSERLLFDARHGDQKAMAELNNRIRTDMVAFARAVHRRQGGSPDGGVNGESDLVQGVAAQILAQPDKELADVFTIEQLRGRLFTMLHEKWVDQHRHNTRKKRGGGRVHAASQVGDSDNSSPLNVQHRGFGEPSEPQQEDIAELVDQMLGVFEPGSERQRILLMTLAGLPQEEIGRELGLSRDAVGRRVRNSIIAPLRRRFVEDQPPTDE
jgi:DNA-directed RNA polymerase specialized sigma24 family protein